MMAAKDFLNGNSIQGAPWLANFIVRVGVSTAFAAVLLWFMLTRVSTALVVLSDLADKQQQASLAILANQMKMTELMMQRARVSDSNTRFLQVVCFNTARTDEARRLCSQALQQQ